MARKDDGYLPVIIGLFCAFDSCLFTTPQHRYNGFSHAAGFGSSSILPIEVSIDTTFARSCFQLILAEHITVILQNCIFASKIRKIGHFFIKIASKCHFEAVFIRFLQILFIPDHFRRLLASARVCRGSVG
jgi:hypothetical protein